MGVRTLPNFICLYANRLFSVFCCCCWIFSWTGSVRFCAFEAHLMFFQCRLSVSVAPFFYFCLFITLGKWLYDHVNMLMKLKLKIWYTDRFIYVTKNHCFINLLMNQHFVLIKFVFFFRRWRLCVYLIWAFSRAFNTTATFQLAYNTYLTTSVDKKW